MRELLRRLFIPSAWDILDWVNIYGPVLFSAITALSGYLHGIEPMWILVGASLAFAGAANGLLSFSRWRHERDDKDKLQFSQTRVTKKLDASGHVCEIYLGFTLLNKALFPIEYQLETMETEIAGLFPPKRAYDLRKFTISSEGFGWFDDFGIVIPKPIIDQAVEGKIKFLVRYGRPGRLKHMLSKKMQVFIGFDKKGDITGTNWTETA